MGVQGKLLLELVPASCWSDNLRSIFDETDWKEIARFVYREARYKCEICGGKGDEHPVECHEVWHYDDMLFVQELVGLQALCPKCHAVKHFGFPNKQFDRRDRLLHLMRVNGWKDLEWVESYIQGEFDLYYSRSTQAWTLDVDWVINWWEVRAAGVRVTSAQDWLSALEEGHEQSGQGEGAGTATPHKPSHSH